MHLTWENEAHLEVEEARGELEIVYPPISILAEPHVAVVDANVERKGTRERGRGVPRSSSTPSEAQEIIAKHYYRPIECGRAGSSHAGDVPRDRSSSRSPTIAQGLGRRAQRSSSPTAACSTAIYKPK